MPQEPQSFLAKNNAEARLMQVLKLRKNRTKSVSIRAAAGESMVATVELILTDSELEAIFGPGMRGHGDA